MMFYTFQGNGWHKWVFPTPSGTVNIKYFNAVTYLIRIISETEGILGPRSCSLWWQMFQSIHEIRNRSRTHICHRLWQWYYWVAEAPSQLGIIWSGYLSLCMGAKESACVPGIAPAVKKQTLGLKMPGYCPVSECGCVIFPYVISAVP